MGSKSGRSSKIYTNLFNFGGFKGICTSSSSQTGVESSTEKTGPMDPGANAELEYAQLLCCSAYCPVDAGVENAFYVMGTTSESLLFFRSLAVNWGFFRLLYFVSDFSGCQFTLKLGAAMQL